MWKKYQTFLSVVKSNSFSKAAKLLNISNVTVTRYIQELENSYQSQFFTRTTRHLSLTASGEVFHAYVTKLLETQSHLVSALDLQKNEIAGNIKMGIPASLMHNCFRSIPRQLLVKYPKLSFDIVQGNHALNMLNENFDLALHCGELPNINLFFKKLGNWHKIVCASPEYLKKHGEPESIYDLHAHNCLNHHDNRLSTWHLKEKGKNIHLTVTGNLKTNSSLVLAKYAEDGIGIAYLPHFSMTAALRNKRLIPILKGAWPDPLPIYAVYPQRQEVNKKLAVVIEAFSQFFEKSESILTTY